MLILWRCDDVFDLYMVRISRLNAMQCGGWDQVVIYVHIRLAVSRYSFEALQNSTLYRICKLMTRTTIIKLESRFIHIYISIEMAFK